MFSDDLRTELSRPKPSVAQVAGHAIHPILVAFPIVFYSIATASFIAYAFNLEAFWFRAAFYACVAGVISSVVAAIPGMVDYFGSIPARDPAKKVGRTHIAFNSLALVIFAVIVMLLWNVVTPDSIRTELLDYRTPMWLSLLGLASTLTAAYFGGTLTQQYHVGIQPTVHSTMGRMQADRVT